MMTLFCFNLRARQKVIEATEKSIESGYGNFHYLQFADIMQQFAVYKSGILSIRDVREKTKKKKRGEDTGPIRLHMLFHHAVQGPSRSLLPLE
jgi:hypothetical protein